MDIVVNLILYLILVSIVGGACLYAAGKVTGTACYFLGMAIVAGATELTRLVILLGLGATGIGEFLLLFISWLIPLIVFISLLRKFTRAPVIPDIFLMVVVYWILTFLLGTFIELA
ncbi:MAG: hypothetical protein JJT75_12270 [Opitutales bacterium]|nr:hypothetical protein [Opitutales bacterium]MCH8539813.1 hypothetical protein [Opitutales bacterium]